MGERIAMNYTTAVDRLEEIMHEIQNDTMDIDKLVMVLKEADGLIKFCRARLYKVDEEVQGLLKGLGDESSSVG